MYTNSQVDNLLGYTPQQVSQMGEDFIERLMHPEDIERFSRHIQQLNQLKPGETRDFKYRLRHQNGEWRWFYSQDRLYSRTSNGALHQILGIAQDISDRQLLEAKLIDNERHLRRVLDSLYSFIGVLNPDGIVLEVNRTAIEAANLNWEDVIGKPFAQTYWWSYSTESQGRLNEAIERAKTGEAVHYDVEVRLSEDNYIIIDFALVPLFDNNGRVEYIIPSGIDISDRRQAEQALQNREQQLKAILDTMPIYAGLLDPEGQVIEINQTAIDLSGVVLEETLGRPFAETYWWNFSTEIQAKINDAIQTAAAGETVRFQTLARGATESDQVMVDFSLTPVFNNNGAVEYLVPIGVDITEREKNREAIEQSERELKLITEVIPQQVWTALPDGEVDYINQRWRDFAGASLKQVQNRGWESIVHPDDLERVVQAWSRAVETGNNYSIEARWRNKNGKYHWFLNRAKPLKNEAGEITQWYGTNTDITPIKKLEVKLQQQTEDLVRANQLKDEFLAIVSHELRTPLNPILGWAQLLTAGRLDPSKIEQGINIIGRNAKLQAQLIDDLLDVSRILRGKLNLKQDP
ncbi:MAG: PAS domain S-box protein, partial [Cyanobacteria bacterium P01_G01_bin.19]